MRIGVVGYGTGGQHFHTHFIAAAKGCTLAGIVARAPGTVACAQGDWPYTPIFASLTEMISASVCDAITITTPPQTRRAQVLEATAASARTIAVLDATCQIAAERRSITL
jgi:predicted dehydrogenase